MKNSMASRRSVLSAGALAGLFAAVTALPAADAAPAGGTGSADARETRPIIALTFDDGPSPMTPAVLRILDRHRVRATFFMQGSNVQRYPEYARAVARRGHVVANHGFSHPDFATLDRAEADREITRTNRAIARATGTTPRLFRFPFGNSTPEMEQLVRDKRMTSVLWHWPAATPGDFECPGAQGVTDYVLANAADQAAILLHDGNDVLDCGEGQLAYLDRSIRALKAQGYRFGVVAPADRPSAVNDGSFVQVVPPSRGGR